MLDVVAIEKGKEHVDVQQRAQVHLTGGLIESVFAQPIEVSNRLQSVKKARRRSTDGAKRAARR